jgi:hypothetical protein
MSTVILPTTASIKVPLAYSNSMLIEIDFARAYMRTSQR